MATVGLALIAKNEERNLPHLLESIDGAFDRIVLLDTGSDDETMVYFTSWCQDRKINYSVASYEWCDDFADARNKADNLLVYGTPPGFEHMIPEATPQVDWKVWADCDDEIVGAENIREMASTAPDHLGAFICYYDYAQDPATGHSVCMLKRERVVRATLGEWAGRVHEAQNCGAVPMTLVPADHLLWRHRKIVNAQTVEEANEAAFGSNDRNLRILKSWYDEEPHNPRVLAYLGTETASRGDHEEAMSYYGAYLTLDTAWHEERAQIIRRYCNSLMALGRMDDAISMALSAFAVLPEWPDTPLTLAQAYLSKEEWDKALHWAMQVVQLGVPNDTLLIINPLDYTFVPRKIAAAALAGSNRIEDAIDLAEEAQAFYPGDGMLNHALFQWKAIAKRDRTAETYVMCAEQLIMHDEQAKAQKLLEECVPYFAKDHPKIAQLRMNLNQRISWVSAPEAYADHYENGGSKPEDFLDNETAGQVCAGLPRANFLVDGILDQIGHNDG